MPFLKEYPRIQNVRVKAPNKRTAKNINITNIIWNWFVKSINAKLKIICLSCLDRVKSNYLSQYMINLIIYKAERGKCECQNSDFTFFKNRGNIIKYLC